MLQDQSMKGCSDKELDKDNYQQDTTVISIHCNSGMKYFTCLRKTDWKTAPRAHSHPQCHLEMCTLCFWVP